MILTARWAPLAQMRTLASPHPTQSSPQTFSRPPSLRATLPVSTLSPHPPVHTSFCPSRSFRPAGMLRKKNASALTKTHNRSRVPRYLISQQQVPPGRRHCSRKTKYQETQSRFKPRTKNSCNHTCVATTKTDEDRKEGYHSYLARNLVRGLTWTDSRSRVLRRLISQQQVPPWPKVLPPKNAISKRLDLAVELKR